MSNEKMLSKHNYILKEDDVSRFVPDQTIIIKKRHLLDLPGVRFEEESSEPLLDPEDWYPMVNSYYPFTEDVDAFARVNHLLESRRSLTSLATLRNAADGTFNPYSERAGQYEYLRGRPVSFFIVGKPGLGEEELGKRLSEYWKCVHITPQTLLEEEIESGSRAGQCIEFNLRCGRAVCVDVVIRLLARKLQTPAVLHRGFVLCGFPLIPNDLFEEDPISSESAVFNVQEIFEEIVEQTVQSTDASNKMVVSMIGSLATTERSEVDENVEAEQTEEQDEFVGDSEFKMSCDYVIEDAVCGSKEISNDLQKQLNCLFGLFHEQFVLIYMHAPNQDVVSKRDKCYFDVYAKNTLDMEKIELFRMAGASNEELTEDLFDGGRNPFADNPDLQHVVKLPENFPANVNSQLKRYHEEIANVLDCRVLLHDVQYYLKLDARTFFSRMMRLIKMRLKVLPLQPVVVPRRFAVEREEPGEGVEEEAERPSLDDHFARLSKTQTVSPVFKWSWSDWGVHCPVSMSRGVYAAGSPDFAVHFLNRIFFLRDREALDAFVENPRPFLLPPFPRPGPRVFVFGPPISGKSAVARCLGFLLNSRVLTPRQLHIEYLAHLVAEHRDRVKQAAMAEGLELLTEMRRDELERRREERRRLIEEWENDVVIVLNELRIYIEEFIQESKSVIGSFPVELEKPVSYNDFFNTEHGSVIKEQLLSHNMPVIGDPSSCDKLIEDREMLRKFLPQELQTEISVEPATIFDPFVLEYANKKVDEMNFEEIKSQAERNEYQVYVRGIKSTEEQTDYAGWIIDDMTTSLSLLNQILEDFSVDEVVVLTAANADFLRTGFRQYDKLRTQFRDFRDFFLGIGEEEAAWRCASITSTDSYRKRVVQEVLSEVLNFEQDKEEIEAGQQFALQQYDHYLERYFEEIETVRDFFKKRGIAFVEVDVEELAMPDLLKKVVQALRDKYRPTASEFTDADRAEEVRRFFVEPIGGGEGEAEVKMDVDDFFAENRRYGDTHRYCPVTFSENFVLWRGKERYAAKFREKVYLMATEEDMKKFVKAPRSYLVQTRPPDRFPPPRICVVGPDGAGKSTVSRLTAKNLGVRYFDFQEVLKQAVSKISSLSIAFDDEEDELIPDPLLLSWYEALVTRLWFEEPNKYSGFVLDDFPRQARDLWFMIGKKAVPDLVVCMVLSREDTVNRVLKETVKVWRERQEEDRLIDETLRSLELQNWEERRKTRYAELMEARRQQRYADKKKEVEVEENEFTSDTQVSFDSVVEQQEEDEVMRILNEELPEPLPRHSEESEEEMVERVTGELEKKYAQVVEHLAEVRKICEEHLIPWVDVDASRSVEQIATNLYVLTEDIKYRGRSFFERCYDVDVEAAEQLLENGYYFLSIFGRHCPVQYRLDRNPLQMYFASDDVDKVYPMIHRNYIYFVRGKKNRDKFVKDPLDYVYPKNYDFLRVPMRVAVIGPPKSGKSTLARRFRRSLGFNTITRGRAVREVLNDLLYANLRGPMEKVLRKGERLSEETVMECVYAASHCGESVTFGLVFDGFPNTISEMNSLARLGMVPHLIYDLQVSDEDVFRFASYPSEEKQPLYSRRYVEHLLEEWRGGEKRFRSWCDREYQNIYRLPVDRSVWGVWERGKELVKSVAYERKHYHKHAKSDWPLRLAYMLVTPLEFLERQSNYKAHCPVCFYRSQTFKSGGDPPDRAGLIHFRHFFYWTCDEHVEEFLKSPEKFIPPSNKCLPQDLPERVALNKAPKTSEVAENGFCLVCYWKNVPKKVIRKGSDRHACFYKNKIYLFESAACADEFLANPVEYYQVTINFKDETKYVSLEYRDLPVLGMLEQFVARTVVRAVSHVNLLRPVIPGLSVSVAASICVGLNLKIHNQRISQEYRAKYEEALETFHRRRLDLIRYLDLMKRYMNPDVCYEEPDTPEEEEVEEEDVEVERDEEIEEDDEDYDQGLVAKLHADAVV